MYNQNQIIGGPDFLISKEAEHEVDIESILPSASVSRYSQLNIDSGFVLKLTFADDHRLECRGTINSMKFCEFRKICSFSILRKVALDIIKLESHPKSIRFNTSNYTIHSLEVKLLEGKSAILELELIV